MIPDETVERVRAAARPAPPPAGRPGRALAAAIVVTAATAAGVAARGPGTVLAVAHGDTGVIVEVNSETDFVSKNEKFQSVVEKRSEIIASQNPADVEALKALVNEMNGGQVDTLLVIGGNPAYDAPADLGFSAALAKVEAEIDAETIGELTLKGFHRPVFAHNVRGVRAEDAKPLVG